MDSCRWENWYSIGSHKPDSVGSIPTSAIKASTGSTSGSVFGAHGVALIRPVDQGRLPTPSSHGAMGGG